jgi:hypothetical protein
MLSFAMCLLELLTALLPLFVDREKPAWPVADSVKLTPIGDIRQASPAAYYYCHGR